MRIRVITEAVRNFLLALEGSVGRWEAFAVL